LLKIDPENKTAKEHLMVIRKRTAYVPKKPKEIIKPKMQKPVEKIVEKVIYEDRKLTENEVKNLYGKSEKQYMNGNYINAVVGFKKVVDYDKNHKGAKSYLKRYEEQMKQLRVKMDQEKQEKEEARKKEELDQLTRDAKKLFDRKEYTRSEELYNKVMGIDTFNKEAKEHLQEIKNIRRRRAQKKKNEILEVFKKGKNAFKQNRLARVYFEIVLEMDAGNREAQQELTRIDMKQKKMMRDLKEKMLRETGREDLKREHEQREEYIEKGFDDKYQQQEKIIKGMQEKLEKESYKIKAIQKEYKEEMTQKKMVEMVEKGRETSRREQQVLKGKITLILKEINELRTLLDSKESQVGLLEKKIKTHKAVKKTKPSVASVVSKADSKKINNLIWRAELEMKNKNYKRASGLLRYVLTIDSQNEKAKKHLQGMIGQKVIKGEDFQSLLKGDFLEGQGLDAKDEEFKAKEKVALKEKIKEVELLKKELSGKEKEITVLKSELVKLMNKVGARKQQKKDKAKDQRIEKMLKNAMTYYQQDQFDNATDLLNVILDLDPGNRKASRLQERIKKVIQSRKDKLKETVADYEWRAKIEYKKGNEERAYQYFEKILELDPDNKAAQEHIMIIDEQLKIKNIKRNDSKRIKSLVKQAMAQYKNKKYANAIEGFETVLKIDPANGRAGKYLEKAKQKYRQKRIESKMDADPDIDTTNVNRLYAKGKELYLAKNYQEAANVLEKVVALNPSHKYAPRLLARCKARVSQDTYVATGIPEKEKNQKIMASDVESIYKEGKDLYRAGRFADSLIFFKKVIAKEPQNKYAQKYLLEARQKLKELDEEQKVILDTRNIARMFKRGKKLYQQKNYERALAEFYRILALNPAHRQAPKYVDRCSKYIAKERRQAIKLAVDETVYQRGRKYYETREYEKALDEFTETLEVNPDHREAQRYQQKTKYLLDEQAKKIKRLLKKANSAIKNERYKDAIEFYNKVLDRDEHNKKAKKGLERSHLKHDTYMKVQDAKRAYDAGDYVGTIELANAALSLDKGNKKARKYISYAKTKMDFEKQKKELKKIMDHEQKRVMEEKEEKENLRELFQEGRMKFNRGSYEEALADFQSVLAMDPDHVYAKQFAQYSKDKVLEMKKVALEIEKVDSMQQKSMKRLSEQERKLRSLRNQAHKIDGSIMKTPTIKETKREQRDIKKVIERSKKYYNQGKYNEALKGFKEAWNMPGSLGYADLIQEYIEKSYGALHPEGSARAEAAIKAEQVSRTNLEDLEEREYMLRHKEALVKLGQGYLRNEKYDMAIIQFDKVLEMSPSDTIVQKYRKEAMMKRNRALEIAKLKIGEYEEQKHLDEKVKTKMRVDMLIGKGKKLYQQRYYELAIEKFEEVLILDKDNSVAKEFIEISKQALGTKIDLEEKQSPMYSLSNLLPESNPNAFSNLLMAW